MNLAKAIEIANSGDTEMLSLLKAFCYEHMPGLLEAAKRHKAECECHNPTLFELGDAIRDCETVPEI